MKTKLVVAFDTTGSMAPCIKEVRNRLKEFTSEIFHNVDNIEIQLVAFGDYCDMPKDYFVSPATNDPNVLEKWINKNYSTHGGDGDEYYEYVIKRVREETEWADRNIFILLGDSIPHEVGYKYNGKVYNIDWREEARKCAEMNIPIYAVQALDNSRAAYFYREVSEITNGIKTDLHQLSHIVEYITAISLRATNEEALDNYEKKVATKNRSLQTMFASLRGRKVTFDKIYSETGEELTPVSPSRFQTLRVIHDIPIKDFVEDSGARFKVGKGFYQFTKTETIQENKEVVLRDREGNFFSGEKARELIGVPVGTRKRLAPRYLRNYDVFVQSTSWNRKLKRGTEFLYEIF